MSEKIINSDDNIGRCSGSLENQEQTKWGINDACDAPPRFEAFLLRLSSQLIDLPVNEIDNEIVNGLGVISEFFNVDRITLSQFSNDLEELNATHFFSAPGIPKPKNVSVNEDAPWLAQKILK